ncbi:SUMO-activating enzyme subunit 1 [Pelomyxa schiedti]|nr:SUMO-activating enzyme subunit 1 [Pelomyxa schiedti]
MATTSTSSTAAAPSSSDRPQQQLTAFEAELYDRGIRVWGMDAQRRMRGADVAVIGLSGVGAEIVKNVALAGVRSVTVVDDAVAGAGDLAANFFLTEADCSSGAKRAMAALPGIKALNPLVEVNVLDINPASLTADHLRKFHFVCATGLPLPVFARLDDECRLAKVPFIAVQIYKFQGFFFCDLMKYTYLCKPPETGQVSGPGTVIPRKKTKVVVAIEPTAVTIDFLGMRGTLTQPPQHTRRTPAMHKILQSIFTFCSKHNAFPSTMAHIEECKTLSPTPIGDEMLLKNMVLGSMVDFAPVCAVIGGVVAQELIKVISGSGDPPLGKLFYYDAIQGSGLVE